MKLISTLLLTSTLFFLGCGETESNNQKTPDQSPESTSIHNAQNSLDWAGTYSGELPCASCEGIQTTLTLNDDGSYALNMTYLGENTPNSFDKTGSFSWNEAGNTITLNDQEAPNQYFIGENYLAKLDMDGNRISGDLAEKYILEKQ